MPHPETDAVFLCAQQRMCYNASMKYISDPIEYLKEHFPGKNYFKTGECSLPESAVTAYVIRERNGCVVNAAASLITYASEPENSRFGALKACRGIAERLYKKARKNDYYVPLGRTSAFVNECARKLESKGKARSSPFAKRTAVREINCGRPVLLNIAFSPQYRDHTITAYGWEEYAPENGRGRKLLFFKIRDGYTKEPRYLVYRRIFGIFATYFVV